MELLKKGFMFWPVGNGDSTTIIIRRDEIIMQIDLHQMNKSKEENEPYYPVVDELINLLPKKDGKPYLSVFVLTHPDEDHIQGFDEFKKEVLIGEIWHTPRIFSEYKKDLCEDAIAFKDEVIRRKNKMIKNEGKVMDGDRLRIIGHDEIFKQDEYKDFPTEWRTIPGNTITQINEEDIRDIFEAFVHAPFKEESEKERNNSSLSLHITLKENMQVAKAFFFGDREYPTIKKIFEKTEEKKRTQYLNWHVMLASHHCSKSVMFWKDEEDSDEEFKKDTMQYFEKYQEKGAYLISSSESDFSDKEGKNPPHKKARKKYEEIIEAGNFMCTQEHPNTTDTKPICFELGSDGLKYLEPDETNRKKSSSSLSKAIARARGENEPPSEKVGFGK